VLRFERDRLEDEQVECALRQFHGSLPFRFDRRESITAQLFQR
jgi:hypothetical protein